jgi:hypothetical protein
MCMSCGHTFLPRIWAFKKLGLIFIYFVKKCNKKKFQLVRHYKNEFTVDQPISSYIQI